LGTNNTALGAYASYENTTSDNNTSVGSNSAFFNTVGSNNTSVGAGSLCNNTTGSLNTAVGSSALEGVVGQSVGNQNTAVGVQALYTNEGEQNTAIGAYAALGINNGNYNTFLGTNTTFDNLSQTYQFSTAIGYGATITGSNQIAMGGNNAGQYPDVIIPGKGFLPNFDAGTATENQIVTKNYVDNASQGFKLYGRTKCIDTVGVTETNNGLDISFNVTLTYTPGPLVIDGYQLQIGDRVLFNNQGIFLPAADPTVPANDNGIYDVSYNAPYYYFTRSQDMASASNAENGTVFIQNGTQYSSSVWRQIETPAVVDIDPLFFNLYNQVGFKIGLGLNIVNNGTDNYINVDNSLNFVNFIDSNSTISIPTGLTGGSGTLAIGTNTNNSIIIGPTGGIPIQAQSVIQAQKGITGATGSFSYLSVSSNNIALGNSAGKSLQGVNAVAIGNSAGLTNQGSGSIAIGYYAGRTNQAINSIVINASGSDLTGATSNATYIAPIRNVTQSTVLGYDVTTKEVTYFTSSGGGGGGTTGPTGPNLWNIGSFTIQKSTGTTGFSGIGYTGNVVVYGDLNVTGIIDPIAVIIGGTGSNNMILDSVNNTFSINGNTGGIIYNNLNTSFQYISFLPRVLAALELPDASTNTTLVVNNQILFQDSSGTAIIGLDNN
ncbi:hypothetical protein EBU71_15885, partial [bacterium]|nr:hypothetical protein [Candidatus Elulimicrobium humile]